MWLTRPDDDNYNFWYYIFMWLFPLPVLLFWSVMLYWIMLLGMDLSPKGRLFRWCMWVYIRRIAVFAWGKRWEYRSKETSLNILFYFFGSTLICKPPEKGIMKYPRPKKPTSQGFICDDALDMRIMLIYSNVIDGFSLISPLFLLL